jgi:PAS domain S-box-containing protein
MDTSNIDSFFAGHALRVEVEHGDFLPENVIWKLLHSLPVYFYYGQTRDGKQISTYHSPQCQAITGYSPQEYYFDPDLWIKMVHEEDRAALRSFISDVAKGFAKGAIEHRIVTKRGSTRWVLNDHIVIKDSQNNSTQEIGILLDITDMKMAEDEVHNFFSLPLDIMCIIGQDFHFIRVNPTFHSLLGYAESEMLTKPISDFIHPDDREKTAEAINLLGKRPTACEFENRFRAKNGEYHWLLWKVIQRADGGKLYASAREITDRKKMEAELKKQKDIAEKAVALKDTFLSIASHDLKTPLSTMVGFLRLMRSGSEEKRRRISDQIVETALNSGYQALGLIDEILDLSRFKTGGIKRKFCFTDAYLAGEKTLMNSLFHAVEKGITLKNEIQKGSRVYTDGAVLAEILQNIVANAIKFCAKADNIVISRLPSENICISVWNSGPGIPPEIEERLFKNKVTSIGTHGEAGTGYGMLLVSSMIEYLGGEIKYKYDCGCRFIITLPFIRPKVLLASEDENFRLLQKGYLQCLDVDLMESCDLEETEARMSGDKPHLLILDVGKPIPNWLKFLEKVIIGGNDEQSPSVIATSSEPGAELREIVLKLGVHDYMTKHEISFETFVPRIRRLIG